MEEIKLPKLSELEKYFEEYKPAPYSNEKINGLFIDNPPRGNNPLDIKGEMSRVIREAYFRGEINGKDLPQDEEEEAVFDNWVYRNWRYAKLLFTIDTLKKYGFKDDSPVHIVILQAIDNLVSHSGGEKHEDYNLFDAFAGNVSSALTFYNGPQHMIEPPYKCPFPKHFGEPIDYEEMLVHALDYIKEHTEGFKPANNE